MTKICYVEKRFKAKSLAMIDQANSIITEYQEQGYQLTLRQLYYQFVSRDLIPNSDKSYDNLGALISDGRLAGLIDWNAIEDRTRNLKELSHWETPQQIVEACANQFRVDRWENQPYRIECWVEKEALAGVVERSCVGLDVPFFSCRGYVSQSEMWVAGQRFKRHIRNGQIPKVLHLGDHDPSGIDMTRDITERLAMFSGQRVDVIRIALNWDQVKQYNPPPNPAKVSDSRFIAYQQEFGDESWELDALEPKVIDALIQKHVKTFRDDHAWNATAKVQDAGREALNRVVTKWDELELDEDA